MRPAEPEISTLQSEEDWLVCARYECPEGLRLILSLRMIIICVAFTLLAWLVITLSHLWPDTLSDGERMVVMFAALASAWGIARFTGNCFADLRFCLRRILDRTMRVAMCRAAVTSGGISYPRDRKIAFTSEPHRWAKREDRAERVSGETIPETYRSAYEVKLQHGETLIVLAEVSDEKAANAIVRRLQVVDEIATRGTGAKGTGFGPRQSPE
jgi:hypothetical protein